jgi:polyphenol oxidase
LFFIHCLMFSLFKKYPNLFLSFSGKDDGSMKLTSNSLLRDKIGKNRSDYFKKIGIDPSDVVSAEIIHENKINVVTQNNRGKVISGADGLVSNSKNIYLSVTSADCLPIFLFDPKKEIVGMIHAGWRSLEKDILANALKKIKMLGGSPQGTLAGIGPSICQKHYEVAPEISEKFSKFPEDIKQADNKLFLDIKKIAQLQLFKLGIKKENIEISPECTFELPTKYFSARRDKKKEVAAMIALIGLRSF